MDTRHDNTCRGFFVRESPQNVTGSDGKKPSRVLILAPRVTILSLGSYRLATSSTVAPQALPSEKRHKVNKEEKVLKKRIVLKQWNVDCAKPDPNGRRIEQADAGLPGFYMITHATGKVSFAYRYRIHGKSKKWTIGYHPAMPLAEAHKLAREAIGSVARGVDPAAMKAAQHLPGAPSDVPVTVGELIEKFLEKKPASSKRLPPRETTWKGYERMLRSDISPAWGSRRIDAITAVDIEARLEEVAEVRPVLANRLAGLLSKLFKWAVKKRFLAALPMIERPTVEASRERVLKRAEVKLVLDAACRLHPTGRDIVHLLFLTLARRNEIANMEWSEINMEEGMWVLPEARSKNRREFHLPLSDDAMAILRAREQDRDGPLVFPGGRRSFNSFTRLKTKLDKLIAETNGGTPIPHWQFHDIRRSAVTFMQELGISLAVTERVLNHAGGALKDKTAATYHRYGFEGEMHEAMEKWATLLAVIRASNVVEMRRRA